MKENKGKIHKWTNTSLTLPAALGAVPDVAAASWPTPTSIAAAAAAPAAAPLALDAFV
jgi:hypothetical protein